MNLFLQLATFFLLLSIAARLEQATTAIDARANIEARFFYAAAWLSAAAGVFA